MEVSFSIEEISQVAKTLIDTFSHQKKFAFYADMGSGKTTLISALCHQLGVTDNVSSPTFSIINEYRIEPTHEKVFHMDWYRLKNTADAIEAGVQDILEDSNAYCFIEWPEIAPELISSSIQCFNIEMITPTQRTLVSLP